MKKISVTQHMNEIRNVLLYAHNVGFFFGAGTSCAFGLPTVKKLTENIREKFSEVQKTLYDKIISELATLTSKEEKDITIEDILNYIRQVRSITHNRDDYMVGTLTGKQAEELDKSICRLIFEIIKECEDKADITELRRFMAWYDSANRSFVKEIFTTNYDMLLEMAMEANYLPYYDGFIGSYESFFAPETIDIFPNQGDTTASWIRLWKIHGSLNWISQKTSAAMEERIIRIGKIGSPNDNELMIYPSREKYQLSRKEPYIAYFDHMKNYLQKGELVFICSGYSFSDQHINEVFFNALRQNNRLYVIVFCYSDENVESLEQYAAAHNNLCVMGPKKVIVNGQIKEWVMENQENDQNYHDYWNDEESKFILGNFKLLIDFLIDNSGRKTVIEEALYGK